MVVTEDGELWTCGKSGVLGHGDHANRLVLTRVGAERFRGTKIAMVTGGLFYSIAVNDTKEDNKSPNTPTARVY